MTKITTVLFDFDGVITNTEPQYHTYFDNAAQKYKLGIDNFGIAVQGMTFPDVLTKYFANFSQKDIDQFTLDTAEFERQLHYPPVKGAIEFIQYLKANNYKIGLVTSSQDFKMQIALKKMELNGIFDTEVTANRITKGKPDPMCYQLAAQDLGATPEECIVFEDAIAGIKAASSANIRVIGVSTTMPEDTLEELVYEVIPDFSDPELILSYFN
ncbi:MAG: HAD family phosphatase [Dysgonomonas sp.]